jgi:hypothetical protein
MKSMASPGGIPRPPTPRRRPDHKSPQVEATTCRSPGSLDWPGFIFVAVKGRPKFNFLGTLPVGHCQAAVTVAWSRASATTDPNSTSCDLDHVGYCEAVAGSLNGGLRACSIAVSVLHGRADPSQLICECVVGATILSCSPATRCGASPPTSPSCRICCDPPFRPDVDTVNRRSVIIQKLLLNMINVGSRLCA